MKESKKIKIGLFGIGLDTYWPQFSGLLARLMGYQERIHDRLKKKEVEVSDFGMVDSPQKAQTAATYFQTECIDILFLYISTYALSSTVLPILQQNRVPVILLNLQPVNAIDYESFNRLEDRGVMTGEWLAHCQACSVPEIANVLNRSQIDYSIVTGTLEDSEAWEEIHDWIDAAQVAKVMKENRVGVLGHYYCGMLDVYSDLTLQSSVFGNHFELLEMCDLFDKREHVTEQQLQNKLEQFYTDFEVSPECEEKELIRAAKTSVALDLLVAENDLGSMAYYYEGTDGNPYENIVTSIIPGNTLLTANHIPVAGECEIKNVQAMKILDAFGVGGAFNEFYAMDLNDNVVLLGHDGPGHAAIAQEKIKLVPLPVYHGKPGKGLSIQMEVQHGPITTLSVLENHQGEIKLLFAEGECVPGPTLQIGNTNSRYRFDVGVKNYINGWSKAGPSHHCAVGIGHVGKKLKKLANLLKIESIQIS